MSQLPTNDPRESPLADPDDAHTPLPDPRPQKSGSEEPHCSTCRGPVAVRPGSCPDAFHDGLLVTMDNGSQVLLVSLSESDKLYSSHPVPSQPMDPHDLLSRSTLDRRVKP